MAVKDFFNPKKILDKYISEKANQIVSESRSEISANMYAHHIPIYFGGEKTPFELGTPSDFELDYYAIRKRAWESYIKTDTVQNAIKKYLLWVVGSGLKMQSEPAFQVLQSNGVDITAEELKTFSELSEQKFRLYAKSLYSTYNENQSLHDLAIEAGKNALLAGDVLVLERFNGDNSTTDFIDGGYICNPVFSDYYEKAEKRGNKIIDGVEINKKGKHVAFYVIQEDLTYKRIPAYSSSGRMQAWLMYGLKSKSSDVRGMSLLTAIMESHAKLDRYKEASIGSAEEQAKIYMTVEHGSKSDGENPIINPLAKQAFNKGKGVAPETRSISEACDEAATKITQTTGKQAINMPVDSQLKMHSNVAGVNFESFWKPNMQIIYATIGIPPEVAMDLFGGAYSGSRAALMSWQHKMKTDRTVIFERQFYQRIYAYWLDINVLTDKINLPQYLKALLVDKNKETLEAFRSARFIGPNVPHIDPVKEANAERIKLGKGMDNVPLSSVEQSMENLTTGEFEPMIKKVKNEKDLAKDFIDSGNKLVKQ